jgi:hypothetical protein
VVLSSKHSTKDSKGKIYINKNNKKTTSELAETFTKVTMKTHIHKVKHNSKIESQKEFRNGVPSGPTLC